MEHEYLPANPAEFRFADLSFYDRVEREFGTHGFQTLGDWEDVTVSRTFPQMRTFIRQMVNADGSTVASIYHVKIRGWMKLLTFVGVLPAHMRTMDLESEFADRTFLCSSNTLGQDLSSGVTGIERQTLPVETTPETLLAAHRSKLTQLGETGGQSPVVIRTPGDALAMQHRVQALKNREKQSAGYVDIEQFDRCGRGSGESPEIQQMPAQLARLQAQEIAASGNAPTR
jgi:hypothetical protein